MTARQILYAPSGTLRAWWRVGGFVLLFFAMEFALGFVVRRLPLPASIAHSMKLEWLIVLSGALLANAVMLRLVDKRAWSTAALGRDGARPRVMAAGLAMGGLAILVPSALLLSLHWMQPGAPTLTTTTLAAFTLQAALLFLPQSLAEELISRGYAFTAIREGGGPIAAIAITSLVFGGLHLQNPGADAWTFSIVVLAGIWLGAIVVITRSVYAAWMAHFAWNFSIVGILHATVSGITFATPGFTMVNSGPAWATGGSWGPEGSAFAAASVSGSIGLLYWWDRKRQMAPASALAHG